MNVYLKVQDGIELVGTTTLEAYGQDYVLDLDLTGTGQALRLTYELEAVPYLTPEMTLGSERAVMLQIGQTPCFLPGWQRSEED